MANSVAYMDVVCAWMCLIYRHRSVSVLVRVATLWKETYVHQCLRCVPFDAQLLSENSATGVWPTIHRFRVIKNKSSSQLSIESNTKVPH